MVLLDDDDWGREHLTPKLREHFERVGEELVQFDVTNKRYSSSAKHFAALYWLRERRGQQKAIEKERHDVIVVLTGATLLLTFIGIAVAVLLHFLK